jgi:hypothetical protein
VARRGGIAARCDYSGATTCVYVQAYWNAVNGVIAPDSLPLNSDGVVTHVHGKFYGGGMVRVRVVHQIPDYAHRVRLPRMSRRIARVVLVARSLAGRLEGRTVLGR